MFYVKKKKKKKNRGTKKRREERMLTDPSLCYSTGVIMSYCTNRLDLIIKSCTFKKRSSLSLSGAFSFPNNKS